MSRTLVEHARHELTLCGDADCSPSYAQMIIGMVAVFESYGHSGTTANVAINQLNKLLRFEPLSGPAAPTASPPDGPLGSTGRGNTTT